MAPTSLSLSGRLVLMRHMKFGLSYLTCIFTCVVFHADAELFAIQEFSVVVLLLKIWIFHFFCYFTLFSLCDKGPPVLYGINIYVDELLLDRLFLDYTFHFKIVKILQCFDMCF